MKFMVHPEMIEATRLTRAGKLNEATALLLRLMQKGHEPGAPASEDRSSSESRANGATPLVAVEWSPAPPRPKRSLLRAWPQTGAEGAKTSTIPPASANGLPAIAKTARAPAARQRPVPTITPTPAPKGARFLSASFTNGAGTRAYKLYVPSAYNGQPLPLIVMLHGCTQSADDFAAGTRMNEAGEDHACLVAYPIQTKAANASKCWNWFNPADQQRGRGEPSIIAGITRRIMREYAIDPKRVYVAGLSAGAAAAAVLAETYPDIYAAAGVHSGLACGLARDIPSAFAAMREGAGASNGQGKGSGSDRAPFVPTIVFHGDKDVTVNPRNGAHVIERSASRGRADLRSSSERGTAPGGRAYSKTTHRDASGRSVIEMWVVHGAGHAWSGGSAAGSFTDPLGPDASREMIRFFLEHARPEGRES